MKKLTDKELKDKIQESCKQQVEEDARKPKPRRVSGFQITVGR